MTDAESTRPRMLTFASGGWVLLLTAVLAVVIFVATMSRVLEHQANRPPGDMKDPASYGFDLSNATVPVASIVPGQLHRDMLPPLIDAAMMPGADVLALNREIRGKYLVPTDQVIGVEIDGDARAYPLLILRVREVANDVVGGQPILVTYNPVCDSAVVFDRTVAGTPREFGRSGLFVNSSLLLYDRVDAGRESLWPQMTGRAISGPEVESGAVLERVPFELTQWGDWFERHPETTVLAPDVEQLKLYKATSFSRYFLNDELLFPVDHAPPADGPPVKAPCLVVRAGGVERVFLFSDIVAHADDDGRCSATVGDEEIAFLTMLDPETIRANAVADGRPVTVATARWFALYTQDPAVLASIRWEDAS